MRLGRFVRLLFLAIWFGSLTGIVEIALVQMAVRGGLHVRLSADYVWMAPVANVFFAIVVTSVALCAARIRRGWDPAPTVLGILSGLLILSIAGFLESLHRGAVLLLAAGIGSQMGRLARSPRARRLFVIVPPTAVLMAGWVGYLGFKFRSGEARREAAALAALPAPPAGASNVLLLILDTVRRQVTWDGDAAQTTTPVVDSFARRGVTFTRAIAPAPWTLPSHASFFTGRLPVELSASLAAPLDDQYPTLAEYLAGKGYLTAGFVANLAFATRASGLGRGFVHYEDYPASFGQLALSSSIGRMLLGATWLRRVIGYHQLPNRRTAGTIVTEFLDWQAQHRGRPTFAFVNLFDAHEPYFPPGRSGSLLWPGKRWTGYEHVVGLEAGANAEVAEKWALSPEQVSVHAEAYLSAVSEADAEAGRLLAELERRGALENTLVVIASDHGEQTGEHKLFGHLNSLYLPTLHVPLAIVSPRTPQGVTVETAVGLRDLPATILDLLGLAEGSPFPGRSLARQWTAPAAGDTVFSMLQGGYARQARYPIGHGREMFSLTTTAYQYIRNANGSEELFDLRRDPGGRTNLAATPDAAPALSGLRDALNRLLRDARPAGRRS